MESLHYGKILGEDRTNIGFYWEIATGIYYANLGGEGVAMDGDAEPSTASGGCSEAEHPQRSKNRASEQREDFFGHREAARTAICRGVRRRKSRCRV